MCKWMKNEVDNLYELLLDEMVKFFMLSLSKRCSHQPKLSYLLDKSLEKYQSIM